MLRVKLLEELFANVLNEIEELLAILIVDLDGLIIARQSINDFDEEIIGAIMGVLDGALNKIKRFAETSYGSGTFDTNEFRLFYLELGNLAHTKALLVLVSTPFSNIDGIVPYAYIAAEKTSQILNDKEISILIPNLRNGKKEMILHEDHSSSKSIINKIAIIGDDFVGKTTLINMYVNGEFNDEYKPTIGISIVEKKLQLMKNVNLIFKLFDFGGLRTFAKVRRHFYRGSDAIIVIFDYSSPDSLEKLNEWIEESIQFIDDHSVPYLIVGNKIDKVNERKNIRDKLVIFAKQYNFPIFETSSLTGEGIDEIFMYLTSNIKF